MNEDKQGVIESISKSMVMVCLRNSMLEHHHAGIEPLRRTGDFTDVMAINATSRKISRPEVSRTEDQEMGCPVRQVGDCLNTFHAKADDLQFLAMMDRALAEACRWDEPELDDIILSPIASSRRRAEEGD